MAQSMICLKYVNFINLEVYFLQRRLRVQSMICHFGSHILIIVLLQDRRAVLLICYLP